MPRAARRGTAAQPCSSSGGRPSASASCAVARRHSRLFAQGVGPRPAGRARAGRRAARERRDPDSRRDRRAPGRPPPGLLQTSAMSAPASRHWRTRSRHAARDRGARHVEVVGEDRALEAEIGAQLPLQPHARQARDSGVDTWIADVRHHDARQTVRDQPPVGRDVVLDLGVASPVLRQLDVGVRHHGAVPREMLGHRGHAGRAHALHVGQRQRRRRPLGSRCSARSPMTSLTPQSRSTQGAKLKSTPTSMSSAAMIQAQVNARCRARSASRSYSLPSQRSGGSAVKPSRKRCTRPPSWSTAISGDGLARGANLGDQLTQLLGDRGNSCVKRMTPPTSGLRRRSPPPA